MFDSKEYNKKYTPKRRPSYDWTLWSDSPHELCGMAKEEQDKIYKKSCRQAIQDIQNRKVEREIAIADSVELGVKLMEAYDRKDQQEVEDILEAITDNLNI